MTAELIPYDQARIMLAQAKSFDDVKEIMNRAEAMAVYFERANDKTLQLDAIEIQFRAQCRYGEMLAEQKKAGLLNRGRAGKGRPPLGGEEKLPPKPETDAPPPPPTLADIGVTKQFSARVQKLAALPPDAFEAKIATWREEALAADHVTTNLLEVGRKEEQAQSRRNLASALADTSDQLLTGRKVPCIYLDPAYARKAGIGDRAYENHYPTDQWDAILKIMQKAATRLQPDAWAFIWIPRAHMLALHPVKYSVVIDDGSTHDIEIRTPLIWAIARALGCTDYSTCFVWTKTDEEHPDEHGTFLVAKDQDEILCLYKKGNGLPKPKPEHIYGSNHRERSRPLGHSTKPKFYRKMIADMIGCDSDGKPLPVLEMFCRHDPDNPLPENWEAWGNEAGSQSESNERQNRDNGIKAAADGVASRVADGRTSDAGAASVVPAPIPQEASGTARKAPGGSSSGEPSAVVAYTSVSDGDGQSAGDAAGEAGSRPRLQFIPDPDRARWEDEGGAAADDGEPLDLPASFVSELQILKRAAARR